LTVTRPIGRNLAIDGNSRHAHRLSAWLSSSRFSQRPRQIKRSFIDADYMRKTQSTRAGRFVSTATRLLHDADVDRIKIFMHNYSGMGLGGATGFGIDPFITNKQVVSWGDSTFFHSGQIAISNSIKNGRNITYIILDNKNDRDDGQQTTPASNTISSAMKPSSRRSKNHRAMIEDKSSRSTAPTRSTRQLSQPARIDRTQEWRKGCRCRQGMRITFHRRRNRTERGRSS